MTKRPDTEFLEVVICKSGKKVELNLVLNERLRILTEAKSFEPLRNVVRHGASLREAGFAEAVQEMLCIRFVAERQGMARCLRREPGREL